MKNIDIILSSLDCTLRVRLSIGTGSTHHNRRGYPLLFSIMVGAKRSAFSCKSQESILVAMIRQGKTLIPVGCRSGGCGVCKVRIAEGDFECGKMSRAHVSVEEEAAGIVLACRCIPKSDLHIEVVGEFPRRRARQPSKEMTTNQTTTL